MERPHISPPSSPSSPRPRTQRQRSNSFPLVDALGCSTPEAELILAEGRAAVRSRHASAHRRGRRIRSANDQTLPFRPQEHLKYLDQEREAKDVEDAESSTLTQIRNTRHTRIPSNVTDRSGSTITGLAPPTVTNTPSLSPTSPIGDYSANLAKFIQTQLNSIASYHNPMVYPRSCPDLSVQASTPPLSPAVVARRHIGAPSIIEIPAVRPPLRSTFSAWSSTDDEAEYADDVPPLPSAGAAKESKASNTTPSILKYYENSNNASFLFTSTPLEESGSTEHPNAEGFSFPMRSAAQAPEPPSNQYETDYPSSALSSRPQLTTSSAPSVSSTSTGSYFDCKRPMAFSPHVRAQIIAAVSPRGPDQQKILQATSPFEGGALANVHDILVESQRRVLVDGLSFDLVKNFSMPEAAPSVTTPC